MAFTLNSLGNLYVKTNSFIAAKNIFNELLLLHKTYLLKVDPDKYNPLYAGTLRDLYRLNIRINNLKQADIYYIEVVELAEYLAKISPDPYAIDYALTLFMGVHDLDKNRDNLIKAKKILQNFRGNPQADALLDMINEM